MKIRNLIFLFFVFYIKQLTAQIINTVPLNYFALTFENVVDGQVAMRLKDCQELNEIQVFTFDNKVLKAKIVKTEMHKDGKELIKDGKKYTTTPCRKTFQLEAPVKKGVIAAVHIKDEVSDFKIYKWNVKKTVEQDLQKVSTGKRIESLSKDEPLSYAFNEHGKLFVGIPSNLNAKKKLSNFNSKNKHSYSICETFTNKNMLKVFCSTNDRFYSPVFLEYFFSKIDESGYFDGYYGRILWDFRGYAGLVGEININKIKYYILVRNGWVVFYDHITKSTTDSKNLLTDHRWYFGTVLKPELVKKLRTK